MKGWIGVDLDGTLAFHDGWREEDHIGEPIPLMVDRVKSWLAAGKEVRIVTARVHDERGDVWVDHQRELIYSWCEKHIGRTLRVTCSKDFKMIELWDDRAVQVRQNTGERIDDAYGPYPAIVDAPH